MTLVSIGGTVQLTPTVSSAGHGDTNVTWSVNGTQNGNATVGTITPASGNAVVYTAPSSVPTPAAITILATSVADSKQVRQSRINYHEQLCEGCHFPQLAMLSTSGNQQFTATVTGATNLAVTWV